MECHGSHEALARSLVATTVAVRDGREAEMTAKVGQGIDRIAESRPVRHGRAEGGRLLEIRFHPPFHCQALVDIGQQIPVQALRVGLLRRRFRSGKRFESRIALQLLGEAAAQRSERLPDSGLPVDHTCQTCQTSGHGNRKVVSPDWSCSFPRLRDAGTGDLIRSHAESRAAPWQRWGTPRQADESPDSSSSRHNRIVVHFE